MKRFASMLKHLLNDESGQDLVEYVLVVALIALFAAASMKTFANTLSNVFNSVGNTLTNSVNI